MRGGKNKTITIEQVANGYIVRQGDFCLVLNNFEDAVRETAREFFLIGLFDSVEIKQILAKDLV